MPEKPSPADYELVAAATARKRAQPSYVPPIEVLRACDRILVDEARQRIAAAQKTAAAESDTDAPAP